MKLAIVFLILALLACSFVPSSAYRPRRDVAVNNDQQKELFSEFREARKELSDDSTLTEQQKIDKAKEIANAKISY